MLCPSSCTNDEVQYASPCACGCHLNGSESQKWRWFLQIDWPRGMEELTYIWWCHFSIVTNNSKRIHALHFSSHLLTPGRDLHGELPTGVMSSHFHHCIGIILADHSHQLDAFVILLQNNFSSLFSFMIELPSSILAWIHLFVLWKKWLERWSKCTMMLEFLLTVIILEGWV